MDYVAIDFEPANSQRSSPCAVGVVVVKGGEVTEKFYTLIKPMDCRFDGFNIGIHGITPEDVENEPEFPEIWPDLKPFLESDTVIAHNAGFDMGEKKERKRWREKGVRNLFGGYRLKGS